jgi:two-component system sensor histidine kinase RegB
MTAEAPTIGWLARLRWAAWLGEVVAVLVAGLGLGLGMPWMELAILLTAQALTNAAASAALRGAAGSEQVVTGLLAMDAVFLTALFYLTGGPANPFSFLFLVHLALAAVVLPPRRTWPLFLLSAVLFGLLFLDHRPLMPASAPDPADLDHAAHGEHGEHGEHGHGGVQASASHAAHDMDLHLRGMWVAFVVAGGFIVTFVGRVTAALAARERDLVTAREAAARSERLASLATLAAGAAHELATPLSTIALIARELEHGLADGPPEAAADARTIRQQVERCREILAHLRADAGDAAGEAPERVDAGQILRDALAGSRAPGRVEVTVDEGLAHATVLTFPRTLAAALRGLVNNALDATEQGGRVTLSALRDGAHITFRVDDDGPGIPPDVLDRVGEPFFTTKPTGRGMGLGVFLARQVAARLGGNLTLGAAPGGGTRATLRIAELP